MKKIAFVSAGIILALSAMAQAQSFDVNSLPFSSIKPATDNVATGSIAANPVMNRTVKRDGVLYEQKYVVLSDGSIDVASEKAK